MPRMPRRDAPGALHHVTVRGVARCDIFVDDADRAELYRRMVLVSREHGSPILAFAFMGNHIHVVVQTGPVPLATTMARIATGYALYFNRRHGRVGHLFQNRYHAEPIEDDAHLRHAIRYVHVNPLAVGILRGDVEELDDYPWTGHEQLIAGRADGLLDLRAALAPFGETIAEAQRELRSFMLAWRREEPQPLKVPLPPLRLPQLEDAIARVAVEFGIAPHAIASGSRRREVSRARAEVARVAIAVHRLPAREVALRLGVTHAAVLRGAGRAARKAGT